MDFDDSPREAEFRAEARAWLEQHARLRTDATEKITVLSGFDDSAEALTKAKEWQRLLAAGGWAAITWPAALGGREAGPLEALVWAEELNRFELPTNIFSIGIAMIGPTIIAHGTAEQQARYLKPMVEGREVWCQLWSEPGAGSDLASLSSKAVRDGDHYVLSGQKVWTSGAHYCDFGLGLFRSDPSAPKHHGITALIVDMRSPGIDIRPLRQITGDAHFNEVFFDEVRVPVENRVGEEHEGWRVGRTTMMNERFAAGAMGAALGPVPGARSPRDRDGRRGRSTHSPGPGPGLHVVAALRPHHRTCAHQPRSRDDPRRRGIDPQAVRLAGRHRADRDRLRAARSCRRAHR